MTTVFTADAARALSGPTWLREARAGAAERFAAAAFPSPDEEIWRYSRIAELDLDTYVPVALAADRAGLVHAAGEREGDAELVGAAAAEAPDLFAELNSAFSAPLVISVPRGTTVAEPIVIDHAVTVDGSASFPRLLIDAGEDSEVTVVEHFRSPEGQRALVVPFTYLRVGAAARVKYLAVNELGQQAWQLGHQLSRSGRDSTTQLATVALGGDYARIQTDARLEGAGATGEQVAVYFGEGHQMHDFRTLQDHAAPKTTSTLLFKGAMQGHAHSVYTGLIRVRKDAKGTNAFQTNRNLKLSEGAWAESVPNLDIETNDVRCSHASAVGPIDEEQRFYLESRGIPTPVAERLIVLGFFDEVLAQLPAPLLAARLRGEVAAKLDRRDEG